MFKNQLNSDYICRCTFHQYPDVLHYCSLHWSHYSCRSLASVFMCDEWGQRPTFCVSKSISWNCLLMKQYHWGAFLFFKWHYFSVRTCYRVTFVFSIKPSEKCWSFLLLLNIKASRFFEKENWWAPFRAHNCCLYYYRSYSTMLLTQTGQLLNKDHTHGYCVTDSNLACSY